MTHVVEADCGAIEALGSMLLIRAFEGKSIELQAHAWRP
jgi:hypothetical protein